MLKMIKNEYQLPTDLMSISEFKEKYGYKYGYLYKWSVLEREIPFYMVGGLKLSEKDVLAFEERKRIKKYGRN